MSPLTFARPGTITRPLHLVGEERLAAWRAKLSPEASAWISGSGFTASAGALVLMPGPDGTPAAAAFGLGGRREAARRRFLVAEARARLPEGTWAFDHELDRDALGEAALGWLLAGYRFDRYAKAPPPKAMLLAPKGVDATKLEKIAAGEVLTRDLINVPASDMGPAELVTAARELAEETGAELSLTKGKSLLSANLPLIHAVGRASPRAPRLIELNWGGSGPRITLVGKGVCFDTGGLNLKPGASMGLMKKDMGGAAAVLGLARMIMTRPLKVRLRV
ncbi:MAG: leucyl aminopeptidase family protein, partial [Pseudomonadota bacterium]